MKMLGVALVALVYAIAPQDVEFLRALERAQAEKPARLSSTARIAPESEPGTPLVIDGRVFQADGRTPAAGVTVFAYHTDRNGHYDVPGAAAHSWRLKGWALTDGEGRFTFHTIRPGPYPRGDIPAHVHFNLDGPGVPRLQSGGLEFDDDPRVTPQERDDSRAAGIFGGVRPVISREGVPHVEVNLRIATKGRM